MLLKSQPGVQGRRKKDECLFPPVPQLQGQHGPWWHTRASPERGVSTRQVPAAPSLFPASQHSRTSGAHLVCPACDREGVPVLGTAGLCVCSQAERLAPLRGTSPAGALRWHRCPHRTPRVRNNISSHLVSHHPSGSGVWVPEKGEAFCWECGRSRQRRKGVV